MTTLRPTYTTHIYNELQKKSLNVYGDEGLGRRRLLEDLRLKILEDDSFVLPLNMKSYKKNYNDFIKELEKLESQANDKKAFLFLYNFDAVLDNAMLGEGYNQHFFDKLNGFKNQQNRWLLCITKKPYLKYRYYYKDINRLSPLDLETNKITLLHHYEITNEINAHQLGLNEDDFNLLIRAINRHPKPYHFLKYACKRLDAGANHELLFKKQLKLWEKNLKNEDNRGLLYSVDSFRNKIKITGAELKKFIASIKKIKAILASLGSIVSLGSITYYFDKISDFFSQLF